MWLEKGWNNDDNDTQCTSYSTNDTCYVAYRQGCSDGRDNIIRIVQYIAYQCTFFNEEHIPSHVSNLNYIDYTDSCTLPLFRLPETLSNQP